MLDSNFKLRNMKLKILSILFVGAVFASCQKDRLNPIPQTSLSDAVAFDTPERALQQVNGIYSALKAGAFYAGRYQNYQDIRGEEFLNLTNNGVTNFLTWNFTGSPTTNEVQNFWASAYACINRANVVIAGLTESPIAENLRKQYTAEAKLVRATAYFSLLQLYARPYTEGNGSKPGVPLRLEAITSSGSNLIKRSTVAEVYAQIVKDLNEAEVDLPLNYSSAELNTTRAHRNTAIALKTRVYLSMGQYANVITEGNKIVSAAAPYQASTGVNNKLNANIATTFLPPYTSNESMWSAPFTGLDLPGTQNSLGSYYNPGPAGAGDYALNTTGNGIAASTAWSAGDARRLFNIAQGGQTYLRKWPNNAGSLPDWAPIVRYSEVMLNLAEAEARQGTGVNARGLALVNAVHQRSDPSVTLAPATQADLIDAILTERRIELLGEGFRTSDVTRTGANFAAKGSVSAYGPASTLYIWPISNSELVTNKEMEQNPGY